MTVLDARPNPVGDPAQDPAPRGHANTPLTWEPLPFMQQYLDEQESAGKTVDYLRVAKVGLSRFAAFCHGEGIVSPLELDRQHIVRYQAYLKSARKPDGSPYAEQYQQQQMKYLRSWILWLIESGYMDDRDTPWRRIRVGTTRKKPNPLDDAQVIALFERHKQEAFQLTPFAWHRQEVILTLLYGWGLRIHELVAINVSNCDMGLDHVIVPNKGGGVKAMPYNDVIKGVVGRYLRVRSAKADREEQGLLVSQDGGRLSTRHAREVITALGQRAGVKLHPHMLRDTMGTTMLDHDVELERVMKMLGHTKAATTLTYARVNNKKVAQSHERVMTPLLRKLLAEKDTGQQGAGQQGMGRQHG